MLILSEVLWKAFNLSHFLRSVACRVQVVFDNIKKRETASAASVTRKTRHVIVTDVILGSVLGLVLVFLGSSDAVAETLAEWRDSTKISLERLLTWLMGAPAGLKVNRELTAFLGRLFLYHIEIWVEYLRILQPFLPMVVQLVFLSGFTGLSIMISLVDDVINIATLHVHCFYVYAAKLYSLQITGIVSLARLFTGKKWNELRCRVDTLSSDIDQLAIGTIIFTILLFLLPTVLLYYIVFVSMRLLIYHIQWILGCIIKVLHTTTLYDLMQLVLRRGEVTEGHVRMELQWISEDERESSTTQCSNSGSSIQLSTNCMLHTIKVQDDNAAKLLADLRRICSGYDLRKIVQNVMWGKILEFPLVDYQVVL